MKRTFPLKKAFLLGVAAVVAIGGVLYILWPKTTNAWIMTHCAALEYIQREECGYLTLDLTEGIDPSWKVRPQVTLKVVDKTLQERLSKEGISEITGAVIRLAIPEKIARQDGVDPSSFLLHFSSRYDDYMTVEDVYGTVPAASASSMPGTFL